jgi:methylthioribose-1-phosphate isomerase
MKVNGKPYRTIWQDESGSDIVKIIDQRHLPHEFVVEELASVDDFSMAIKDMHVRGAGLIGATAGYGMYMACLCAPEKNLDDYIKESAEKLLSTRPTASNLAWAVSRQLKAINAEKGKQNKVKMALSTAQDISDEDSDFCRNIGKNGLKLIKEIAKNKKNGPVNILTHCNAGWLAFVDYGSATAPIYAAHHAGIDLHIWVDETRPWLQGAKLTSWELQQEGVPHTLIADNTGGHLMQHDMVDMVIVGTDRTTRAGDVANKIGTYLKALAARDNNIPFYVALPSSTFDWTVRDGLQIPIEERSAEEIKYITGLSRDRIETVLISPPETKAVNYGFDVTPARLISGLITERGVVPAKESAIIELYPENK